MHRIYIWFSFSYLTLIYIYLAHIQSTEQQNLKKNYLDMPPQFSGGQVNLCLI